MLRDEIPSIPRLKEKRLHHSTIGEPYRHEWWASSEHEAYKMHMEVGYTLRDVMDGSHEYCVSINQYLAISQSNDCIRWKDSAKVKFAIKNADVEVKFLQK